MPAVLALCLLGYAFTYFPAHMIKNVFKTTLFAESPAATWIRAYLVCHIFYFNSFSGV